MSEARPPFRERLTEEQRRREYDRISGKLADRFVPVIMERGTRDTPCIDKEKFLVPVDLTVAQLAFVVRKRLKLSSGESLFLMIRRRLCPSTSTVGSVYEAHRAPDGFVYVTTRSRTPLGEKRERERERERVFL